MNILEFKKLPILGILRGIASEDVVPLTEAIIASGLKTIEITMNTVGAPDLIRKTIKTAGQKLNVGAGTITNTEDLKNAIDAGATFAVMPVFNKEVVSHCVKNGIPVFPGALTPQEINTAWQAGATMVKVFPSGFFGPGYFKEIKEPFDKIELLACGGVTPQNIKDYFANGANAVAFGASIFRKEWLENKDFLSIKKSITDLIGAYA
ncbi:MAG: bifunctional 4-hydroxy-2-oxoglutarate aldolase/2-dehydro-3-deoxy-phosphogluconate aldolase [Candidatus Omnitrophota bacterium]